MKWIKKNWRWAALNLFALAVIVELAVAVHRGR